MARLHQEANKIYLTAFSHSLIVEYEEDGIFLHVTGENGYGKAFIPVKDMARFVGACFSAAYAIDGFEKEVINNLYIDRDRIRVIKEGSLNDRVFVKLSPEDLMILAFETLKIPLNVINGEFSLVNHSFVYEITPSGVLLELCEENKKGSIYLTKEQITLLISAVESCFTGRLSKPVKIEREDKKNSLLIDEFIEAKAPPEKAIEDVWINENNEKQNYIKPLYEWVAIIKEKARDMQRPAGAFLRSFFMKHSISYDRKILFGLKEGKEVIVVRLPVHFAKGLSFLLMRWFLNG